MNINKFLEGCNLYRNQNYGPYLISNEEENKSIRMITVHNKYYMMMPLSRY